MAWFSRRHGSGLRGKPASSARPPLFSEALEPRRLMSVSAPDPVGDVVTMPWNGRDVEVIRDSYVLRMPQTNSATAAGLWDYQSQVPVIAPGWSVNSLGSGFYSVNAPGVSLQQFSQWSTASGALVASPNRVYRQAAIEPNPVNDPRYRDGSLWGLNNVGQNGGKADADIDAPEAWEIAVGSRNVVVAVLDDGIDYTHPDLKDNMWRRPDTIPAGVVGVHGYDDADGDTEVRPVSTNSHGTHVAGTIGAKGNNLIGVSGVARNVSLYGAKVFSDGGGGATTVALVSALNRIANLKTQFGENFVAVNASLGGYGGPSPLEFAAIQGLQNAGILFVASAGNDDVNTDIPINDHYPSNYDLPNVISVGASTRTDTLADFSNYGTATVDIAAPGVQILSTVPVEPGQSPQFAYRLKQGTSMAAPHVTGAAVLLASKYRGLTGEWPAPEFLRQAILEGADKVESLVHTVDGVEHRVAENRRLNARGCLDWMLANMPPSVQVRNVEVLEGDGIGNPATLRFTARLNRPLDRSFTFTYTTEDFSPREAIADQDYVAVTSSQVTIPAGETRATFTVQVNGDTTFEKNERLRVRLAKQPGSGGNAWFVRRFAFGTILNDDGNELNPVVDIEPAKTVREGAVGDSVALTFPVLAGGVAARPVTVSYKIMRLPAGHELSSQAAEPVRDFIAHEGSITIPAGQVGGRIPLQLVAGEDFRGDRYFMVELTKVSPGVIKEATRRSLVRIQQDPGPQPPTFVAIAAQSPVFIEGSDRSMRAVVFTITLDAPATRDVVIRYTTVDGTARAGSDYVAASGAVVIRSGQQTANIQVQVFADTIDESNETFFVRISSWSGLPFPIPVNVEERQAMVRIQDDD